jgi:hypothetical protein
LIAEIGLPLFCRQRELASRCNSNELVAVRQFPLSVKSGKPIAATNHRTGFQREMRENYQLKILMGFPLSVLCSGRTIELDKLHILA